MKFEIGMSISRYLPPSGTAGLARYAVSGSSRVPRPPPKTKATTFRTSCPLSLDHKVYQPSRHNNDFHDLLTMEQIADLFIGPRRRFQLGFIGVGCDRNLRPQLPVNLHWHFDRILFCQCRVEFGPRLVR